MKIQIAIVSHRHGNNAYAAKTDAGLYRQLADYCREYWSEAFPDPDQDPSIGDDVNMTDRQIVDAYFEVMNDRGEFLDVNETDLEN